MTNTQIVVKWLQSLRSEIGRWRNKHLWGYEEALDMAIEALSQSEWIPVSDKLPEKDMVVLICWSGGYVTTGCRSSEPEQWLCELDEDNDWCVPIAWMLLPKPYREDGE